MENNVVTKVAKDAFPIGTSKLNYDIAEQVNVVGRELGDDIQIKNLLDFKSNKVPVWRAFMDTLLEGSIDSAIWSCFKWLIQVAPRVTTLGELRKLTFEELNTPKMPPEYAAFLVNAFIKTE